ncbi:MAG: N-formylglutamate amidohydrolase, partial [Phycisphaerales bacterium]|nr:N-formylglutamate amidohydrolase [Phycisphaerales bacterium]
MRAITHTRCGGAKLRGLKPAALSVCALGLLATGVLGPTAPARPFAEPAPVIAAAPGELVSVQHGTLPIILSAPHGGTARVPGSTDRTAGVVVRDVLTAQVALLVAQRLTEKLGAKPSFVVAQFSRKDADANRSRAEGVENEAAGAQYDAYHRSLRALVDRARLEHPAAILIDIHGQARVPDAIVRGTRNGKTVAALVRRRGETALSGPDSLFGRLKAAGYRVLPEIDPERPDQNTQPETFFDGGDIVGTYGSQNEGGIDAIQVELGGMRSDNPMKTARDLADAIAAFYLAHV